MRKYFFIWLMFVPLLIQAQVSINVQLPPGGMVQRDQLWNVAIANNSAGTIDATIFLTLQDLNSGQTLLSASTNSITIPRGVKILTIRDLQPIQYTYNGPDLQGNFLPLGAYNACYTVTKNYQEGTIPVATECVRLTIQPLSPPLLNMPADKSVLKTPYPQFSWIPPAPLDMFADLSYDLSVVEVSEGQSPIEAMYNNAPVYSKGYLRAPYESYPSASSALQTGKQYAWQVVARNGMNYSAQTEIWSFTLPVDSVNADKTPISYLLLSDDNAGVNLISGRTLFIKYYSYYKEQELTLKFMSSDRKIVQEMKQKISYGDNFLELRLSKNFEDNKVYVLELDLPQQRKPGMQFSIKKSTSTN